MRYDDIQYKNAVFVHRSSKQKLTCSLVVNISGVVKHNPL